MPRIPIKPKEHLKLMLMAGAPPELVSLQLEIWQRQNGYFVLVRDMQDAIEIAAIQDIAHALIQEAEMRSQVSGETEDLKATIAEEIPEEASGDETRFAGTIPRLTPPGIGGGGEGA